jgi:hypothetical protein
VNKIKTNRKVKNVRAKFFTAFGIMVFILAVPLTALAEDAGDPASSPEESTQTADSTEAESSSSETGSTGSTESGFSDDSTAGSDSETTAVNDSESSADSAPPPADEAPASEGSEGDTTSQDDGDNLPESEATDDPDHSTAGSDSDTTAADDSESSTDSVTPPADEAPASEDSEGDTTGQDDGDNLPESEATDDPEDPVAGETDFTPSYFEVQQVSMSPLLNPGNIIELVSEDYAEGDMVVAQLSDGTNVVKVLEGDQLVPLGAGVSYSTSEATILGKAELSALTTAELEAGGLGWSSVLATTEHTPTDGDGSDENPYQIATWQNLYWISQNSDKWDKHYLQTADIDFAEADPDIKTWDSNKGWSPIGNDPNHFTGSYDGGEFTISNLYIDRTDKFEWYIGLFGFIDAGAVVENVHLVNVDITGNERVGGLAGYNEGTIKNSSVNGNVTGYDKVGGLVGELNGDGDNIGTIENSYATGTVDGNTAIGGLVGYNYKGTVNSSYTEGKVTGDAQVGGLVGSNDGLIDSCSASSDVEGNNAEVGGLAGYNFSTIENSSADGNVIGNDYVGGLVGSNNGQITSCSVNGNVKGNRDAAGGLAGLNKGVIESSFATGTVDGYRQVGGLVGYNSNTSTTENTVSINNSYASVTVMGNYLSVGGLVGYNYKANVSNCYASGSVDGDNQVGGLVGFNDAGTVENSYAIGAVSGEDDHVGGLVGQNKYGGVITNSYYDSQTTGQNDTGKGEPKTTAEMKTLATYVNWDITGQDGFYPKLGWEINWTDNIWCMGTPPAPDNTSGDFGSFDFVLPLSIQNGTGLTTITNQGNAPITPGLIASGSWNDLKQAVAAYQAALVSLENKITTLSPVELALLEVELVIARAAIMALEAKLLAADGKPFNLASLQAAYAAAVAALSSNQSFLSADQQAAANQLLTAVAGVIAALE